MKSISFEEKLRNLIIKNLGKRALEYLSGSLIIRLGSECISYLFSVKEQRTEASLNRERGSGWANASPDRDESLGTGSGGKMGLVIGGSWREAFYPTGMKSQAFRARGTR